MLNVVVFSQIVDGFPFHRDWRESLYAGEKPFSCLHCSRAFADRSNLRAHLQTHSEVKKYQCVSCFKTFSRISLLAKHQEAGCPLSWQPVNINPLQNTLLWSLTVVRATASSQRNCSDLCISCFVDHKILCSSSGKKLCHVMTVILQRQLDKNVFQRVTSCQEPLALLLSIHVFLWSVYNAEIEETTTEPVTATHVGWCSFRPSTQSPSQSLLLPLLCCYRMLLTRPVAIITGLLITIIWVDYDFPSQFPAFKIWLVLCNHAISWFISLINYTWLHPQLSILTLNIQLKTSINEHFLCRFSVNSGKICASCGLKRG